jgi:hypothetical protein
MMNIYIIPEENMITYRPNSCELIQVDKEDLVKKLYSIISMLSYLKICSIYEILYPLRTELRKIVDADNDDLIIEKKIEINDVTQSDEYLFKGIKYLLRELYPEALTYYDESLNNEESCIKLDATKIRKPKDQELDEMTQKRKYYRILGLYAGKSLSLQACNKEDEAESARNCVVDMSLNRYLS